MSKAGSAIMDRLYAAGEAGLQRRYIPRGRVHSRGLKSLIRRGDVLRLRQGRLWRYWVAGFAPDTAPANAQDAILVILARRGQSSRQELICTSGYRRSATDNAIKALTACGKAVEIRRGRGLFLELTRDIPGTCHTPQQGHDQGHGKHSQTHP